MIYPTVIKEYIFSKFKENYRIVSEGVELTANSPFVEDYNYHFWINLETGLWQDFKAQKKGNIVTLVAELDGITKKRAYSKLLYKTLELGPTKEVARRRERCRAEILAEAEFMERYELEYFDPSKDDFLTEDAVKYLEGRGLPADRFPLFLGHSGPYHDRLVIPFQTPDKDVYFFQARSLVKGMEPKYLNSKGTKASTVVSPFDYDASYVLLVEGPFDYMSLVMEGVNACCVFGSNISSFQMDLFKSFQGEIILGFDNDEAGKKATYQFINLFYKKNMTNSLFTVKLPKDIKDWNELYLATYSLNFFVHNMKREYTWENRMLGELGKLTY